MERGRTLEGILRRDKHICGIHYGGCGKEIKLEDDANIDHMIPKTLLKKEKGDSVFFKPNFLQPMHTACNSIEKRGQLTTYPEFTCNCHYTYYSVETEAVKIYYQHYFKHNDTYEWRKEIFVENFIDHSVDGFGHVMVIGNRGTTYGFHRGNDMGSMFPRYKKSDLYICYLINIFSLLRCKRLKESQKEYVKYLDFIEATDSYPKPTTLDKVTGLFKTLNDEYDAKELANEILYILNPKSYHYRIGLEKSQAGNIESIEHFIQAIALGDKDPNLYSAYSDLGYTCTIFGKYTEAEKYLLKSLELKHDYKYAKGNLAHLYQTQGKLLLVSKKYKEALEFFEKAKAVFPEEGYEAL